MSHFNAASSSSSASLKTLEELAAERPFPFEAAFVLGEDVVTNYLVLGIGNMPKHYKVCMGGDWGSIDCFGGDRLWRFVEEQQSVAPQEQALCSCELVALMQAGCKCGGK